MYALGQGWVKIELWLRLLGLGLYLGIRFRSRMRFCIRVGGIAFVVIMEYVVILSFPLGLGMGIVFRVEYALGLH